MSLGTEEHSGNMGFKDQLLALKWVNENIENFGGDKDRITIFGHSAGGASTQAHILSPGSKGLFQRGIEMSGSVLNPHAIYEEEHHLTHLYEIGMEVFLCVFSMIIKIFIFFIAKTVFRYPVTSVKSLIGLFEYLDASEIMENINPMKAFASDKERKLLWVPVIESLYHIKKKIFFLNFFIFLNV